MEQLEGIRDKMQQQYDTLDKSEDKDKKNLSEVEKNIYNSITSFKEAFSRAGGIFKTHV